MAYFSAGRPLAQARGSSAWELWLAGFAPPLIGQLRRTATEQRLQLARGKSAVQVQRWLGHHSAASTLATYTHLLDDDLGEPLSLAAELSSGSVSDPPAQGVQAESAPR